MKRRDAIRGVGAAAAVGVGGAGTNAFCYWHCSCKCGSDCTQFCYDNCGGCNCCGEGPT